MAAFRAELAKFRAPAIYGGTGAQGSLGTVDRPDTLDTALLKSAGFRLMGQRFVPDSYLLGKLVYPAVGAPTNGHSDMFTCVMSAGGPIRGILPAAGARERAGRLILRRAATIPP